MGGNFSNGKMKQTSFLSSKVKEWYFEAKFQESDLEGSILHHTDLTRADFRNAKNYSINPEVNMLKFAIQVS